MNRGSHPPAIASSGSLCGALQKCANLLAVPCPRCGTKLLRQTLGGLCPRCVSQQVAGRADGSETPSLGHFASAVQASNERIASEELLSATTCPASAAASKWPQLEGFRFLQKLGEGGCGKAYAAEQQRPARRRVALKFLKSSSDHRRTLARFAAEREALASLNH